MNGRPQYITPDGLQCSARNPSKRKSAKLMPQKRVNLPGKGILMHKGRDISKEAAKLTARAIKGMLKQ
jgi:hypothetical protein